MLIKCKRNGSALLVQLTGELDHHSAREVKDQLENYLSDNGIKDMIFDFSQLRFMDSSGIGVLIGRYNTIKKRNGQVSVFNVNNQVDKLMTLSGLYRIIKKIS